MHDRTIFHTAPLFFNMLSPTVDKLLHTPRNNFLAEWQAMHALIASLLGHW
jgi:hypothetical protein